MRPAAVTPPPGICSVLALWLTAGLAGGCGTTATVHRRGGPAYEAEIVRSDANTLYLRDADGEIWPVPGAVVVDIDHPGNGPAAAGATLIGMGWLTMLWSQISGREHVKGEFPLGAIYSLSGMTILVLGGFRWKTSVAAAAAWKRSRGRRAPPLPSPPSWVLPGPRAPAEPALSLPLPPPPFSPQPPPPAAPEPPTRP